MEIREEAGEILVVLPISHEIILHRDSDDYAWLLIHPQRFGWILKETLCYWSPNIRARGDMSLAKELLDVSKICRGIGGCQSIDKWPRLGIYHNFKYYDMGDLKMVSISIDDFVSVCLCCPPENFCVEIPQSAEPFYNELHDMMVTTRAYFEAALGRGTAVSTST